MNRILRSFTAATVLALAPALASAATVDLTFNGATASGTANITATPVGNTGGTGAYGFNMTDGNNILGSFIAWCLDLEHFLADGLYETTNTPFSNSFGLNAIERGRVQAVFDANYATLDTANNTQAAGFQVALWNALYDDDGVATSGVFAVAAGAVGTAANGFLTAATNFGGPQQYNLTFLESLATAPQSQNLVTAAPVPLPAAAFLLAGALGGLGLMRRRTQV